MVGIIIANHNYSEFLADAIDSALNQTVKCYTIVVDDASTDSSKNIALKKIKTTKIEKQENITFNVGENGMLIEIPKQVGPSEARNIAITATYNQLSHYMILDADDIAAPNKVEEMYSLMDEKTGVVYADYTNWNIETNIKLREFKESFNIQRLYEYCMVHSGSLISTKALLSIVDKNGFYDRTMRCAEDYKLWVKIAKKGWHIKHLPKDLTLVRVHNNNSTNSISKQIWNYCWSKVQEEWNV